MAGLRKAQRNIDLRPEFYTHYDRNEFPDRFHAPARLSLVG
jgi:NitT/TauT family transport system substrate-binding protein